MFVIVVCYCVWLFKLLVMLLMSAKNVLLVLNAIFYNSLCLRGSMLYAVLELKQLLKILTSYYPQPAVAVAAATVLTTVKVHVNC